MPTTNFRTGAARCTSAKIVAMPHMTFEITFAQSRILGPNHLSGMDLRCKMPTMPTVSLAGGHVGAAFLVTYASFRPNKPEPHGGKRARLLDVVIRETTFCAGEAGSEGGNPTRPDFLLAFLVLLRPSPTDFLLAFLVLLRPSPRLLKHWDLSALSLSATPRPAKP